jgi:hypothetical protein
MGYGSENEHLKVQTESDRTILENNIKEILEKNPGISNYEAAKRLCPDNISFESFRVKVNRYINRINKSVT